MSEDWAARRAKVAAADGAAWDHLNSAYEEDWTEAYCAEFRRFAKSRGWTAENIESGWLDDMPREAMLFCASGDPVKAARGDVVICENECAP